MKKIICLLGLLKNDLKPLIQPLDFIRKSISNFYRLASNDTNGNPAIALKVGPPISKLNNGEIPDDRLTDSYYLHYALRKMFMNHSQSSSFDRIGLIFADRLKGHKGAFGMMFDLGFNPRGYRPVEPTFTNVPREGCAIFLKAISHYRQTPNDYAKQALFTAVHEIGHVFNLWHKNSPKNFMSTSNKNRVYGSGAFNFHKRHKEFLKLCDSSPYVWPGGSKFGERDILGPRDLNSNDFPENSRCLNLKINISKLEFWNFEPVELDIKLQVSGTNRKTRIRIPDKIDPGYECFQILIQRPDGTLYKYRSPRIYCENMGNIIITPNKSFERDISIFGQSGGYTFNTPGTHTIQAALILPDKTALFSNKLEVEIKPAMPNSEDYRKMCDILSNQKAGLLLYHRNGSTRLKILKILDNFCRNNKKDEISSCVQHALGVLFYKSALGKTMPTIKKYHQKSKRYFSEALDKDLLSTRRKFHARDYLEHINQGY